MQFSVTVQRDGCPPSQTLEFDRGDRRMKYRFGQAFVDWVEENIIQIVAKKYVSVELGGRSFTIVLGSKFFDVGSEYEFKRRFGNIALGKIKILRQFYEEGWIYEISWMAHEYWVRQQDLVRFLTENIRIECVSLEEDPLRVVRQSAEVA